MAADTIPALIVAAPPTAMAALAWWKSRANAATLGKKNGKGPITDMVENLLTAFEQHQKMDDIRFREIAAQIDRNTTDIIDTAADVATELASGTTKPNQ